MMMRWGKKLAAVLGVLLCLAAVSPRVQAAAPEQVIDIGTEKVSVLTDTSVVYRITGTGKGTVTLRPESGKLKVILDNLTLTGSLVVADGADVDLFLEGENTITGGSGQAAVSKMTTSGTLTIDGTGSLTATGGANSAGIGVSGGLLSIGSAAEVTCGNIVINGGTITARGGVCGAGIGGGSESSLDGLIINGGTVSATGLGGAAGIGGGSASITSRTTAQSVPRIDGRNITINGGSVTAWGSGAAAGIGGGSCTGLDKSSSVKYRRYGGWGDTITLNGGSGTIYGGFDNGPGIGGGGTKTGATGSCSKLTIAGGTWKITGYGNAASIGYGRTGSSKYATLGSISYTVFTGGNIYLKEGSNCSNVIDNKGGTGASIGTKHTFSFGADEKVISWVSSTAYNAENVEPVYDAYYFYLSADAEFHTIDSAGTVRCYSTAGGGGLTREAAESAVLDVTGLGEVLLTEEGYIDLAAPKVMHTVTSPAYTLTGGTAASPDKDNCRIYGDVTVNLSALRSSGTLSVKRGSVSVSTTGHSSLGTLAAEGGSVTLAGGGTLSVNAITGERAAVTGGSLRIDSIYKTTAELVGAGGEALYRHQLDFGAENAGAKVTFTAMPYQYLTFGITADENGQVFLYLPGTERVSAQAGGTAAESVAQILRDGWYYDMGGAGSGVITLTGGDSVKLYQDAYIINDTIYTYSGAVTLRQEGAGAVDAAVDVAEGGSYDITLDNLNLKTDAIAISTYCDGTGRTGSDVVLRLVGENRVESARSTAIYKGAYGTLTITGPGSLSAYGGVTTGFAWNYGGAGIGTVTGDTGHISIKDCTVYAQGGAYAAGIGFGRLVNGRVGYSCADIVIENADVTAIGGTGAAGIGGGEARVSTVTSAANAGEIRDIVIRNSTVTAQGGSYGAGIGSGRYDEYPPAMSGIVIENSTVTAQAGNANACGIGFGVADTAAAGTGGSLTGVRIVNSFVTAGSIGGAGTSGSYGYERSELSLSGSTVIGSLRENADNKVVIENSSFMAYEDCPAVNSAGETLCRHILVFDRADARVTPHDGWSAGWADACLYTDGDSRLWVWLPKAGFDGLTADAGGNNLRFSCADNANPVTGVITLGGSVSITWEGKLLTVDVSAVTPELTDYVCRWAYAESADGDFVTVDETQPWESYRPRFGFGGYLRAAVQGKGIYGDTVTSDVLALPAPIAVTGKLAILGTAAAGERVTADFSGVAPAMEREDYTLRWVLRSEFGEEIAVLGDGLTLTIPEDAAGYYLQCEVCPLFPYENVTLQTPRVLVEKTRLRGTMTLTGDGLAAGGYVYAEVTGVEPAGAEEALLYSWQRVRDGVAADLNVTTAYYRLTEADAGCILVCKAVNSACSGSISARVSIPDTSLGTIETRLTALEGGVLRYQMTNNSTKTQAQVIVAAYDGAGRLVRLAMRTVELVNGACTEDLTAFSGAADVRLFWLEDGAMSPLCPAMHVGMAG